MSNDRPQVVVSGCSGISFSSALSLLFIGLKLGGAIDWSWWWVLSPIWISWALVLLLLGACAAIALLAVWLESR